MGEWGGTGWWGVQRDGGAGDRVAGPNMTNGEICGPQMSCSYSRHPLPPFLEMSCVHFHIDIVVTSSSSPASCSSRSLTAAPSDCTLPVPDIPEPPLSQPSAAAFKAGAIRDADISQRLDFPREVAGGSQRFPQLTPAG